MKTHRNCPSLKSSSPDGNRLGLQAAREAGRHLGGLPQLGKCRWLPGSWLRVLGLLLIGLATGLLPGSSTSPCIAQSVANAPSISAISSTLGSTAVTLQEAATPSGGPIDVEAKLRSLDAYIAQAQRDWQVPGLAVAIVYENQVLLCKGYGVLEEGKATPVDEHTLFAIASNTKAFTAAALAILVEEGRLDWDDHVSQYLPWLKLKDPLATSDLRIRDLLCHRSGLGTFSGDLLWWGTDYSPREVLERAVHLEPAGPFRGQYGYSNLMFLAAGLVIETVAEQPWPEFIEQRICQPLEMNRTIFSTRDLISQGNFATPHKTLQDGSQPIPWMNWDSMVAAGGIISSAADMSRWLQCQLAEGQTAGDTRLYSADQAQEMWSAQTPIPVSAGYRQRFPTTHFRAYGLGWSLSDYLGIKLVGHGGGYDGMFSQVAMIPERQLGVVVLTNSMTSLGSALCNRVVDTFCHQATRDWSREGLPQFKQARREFDERIAKAVQPVQANTSPSHALQDYCGSFRCPLYGDARVDVEAGHLVLRLLPNADLVADLEHLHYDTFVVRWRKEFAWFAEGTAHFVANSRGEFHALELDIPNDDFWFYELNLRRVTAKGTAP